MCIRDSYNESTSNYEKLQIYRIIFNENNGNRVVRKFVNETFHVENDYLFQLNPREYDTCLLYTSCGLPDEDLRIPAYGTVAGKPCGLECDPLQYGISLWTFRRGRLWKHHRHRQSAGFF